VAHAAVLNTPPPPDGRADRPASKTTPADLAVDSLLRAVRGRLWRGKLLAAARLAAWGSAALAMLALAIVYFARVPLSLEPLLMAIALVWAGAAVTAAWLRPSESACASWADRHLGGASAYSTLIVLRTAAKTTPSTDAARWLEQWAIGNVPNARRLLATRRDPSRLLRPMLIMLVSAALAAAVLTLPGVAPSPPTPTAKLPAPPSPEAATGERVPSGSDTLAREMETALAPSRPKASGAAGGDAGASSRSGSGETDARSEPGNPQHSVPGAPDEAAKASSSSAANSAGTPSQASALAGASTASGREAGDSRDDRASNAGSLPAGTLSVQRRVAVARPGDNGKQADMREAGSFEGERGFDAAAAATRLPAAPAAAPPATGYAATRLTPTQMAYVQAWLATLRSTDDRPPARR
jgi:hypothetical protein